MRAAVSKSNRLPCSHLIRQLTPRDGRGSVTLAEEPATMAAECMHTAVIAALDQIIRCCGPATAPPSCQSVIASLE